MFSEPIIAIVGGMAGAVVGSFLATVALRWGKDKSALTGRSACDECGARLRWYELVPLASWALLRGRCARCGAAIDPLHPTVEIAAAIVGCIALTLVPDAGGAAGAVFGWTLLLLAALDLRHFWLPDCITLSLLVLGLAGSAVGPPDLAARLIGATSGLAALEVVRRGYARLRGRAGLGGGDPKLMAALGAWLGWAALPGVLLAASITGLAVALIMRLRGAAIDRTTAMPFGALLAAAGFAAWVWQTLSINS